MNDLFYLTDDQRMIRDLARKIARERIAPHAAHYDETESYPEESINAIIESGLWGIWVPELRFDVIAVAQELRYRLSRNGF